jgi:hypothetical protein
VADISVYADTHMAGNSGYELNGFSAIRRWLQRVVARSGQCQ